MLTRAGFKPGTIDGKITPAFTKALKEFQAALALPATGALDTRTSAKLTQVVTRVREVLGIEMPLRRIFEAPTIRQLAQNLDATPPAKPPSG